MAHLPTKILHAVLSELFDRNIPLAPLATVNHHWQDVSEGILWRDLTIQVGDLHRFKSLFYANSARRRSLKHLLIILENYFMSYTKEESIHDGNSAEESEEGFDTVFEADEEYEKQVSTLEDKIDHYDDNGIYNRIQRQFSAFRDEQFRFFEEANSVWEELASWEDDLQVCEITLYVKGYSIYELLGPGFRHAHNVLKYFGDNASLYVADFPQLPSLPSVKTLIIKQPARQGIDLWPAIVACKIAHTLPILEVLEANGTDMERRWAHMRKWFRDALASQLLNLPSSLRTVLLSFEHIGIANQEIQPSSFITGGSDLLSASMNRLSSHLTTLAIRVNHISPALFWNANIIDSSSLPMLWPNLRVLDIRTGFETAAGTYWMRSADNFPDPVPRIWYEHADSDSEDSHSEEYNDDGLEFGYRPARFFRLRPEPELFNELAVSIARASACMPRLIYLNLEFDSLHRDNSNSGCFEYFKRYEGWAFYFRANNEARFASKYFEGDLHEPGPDLTDIERPRTEWVFQCPYGQVQWEEPDEAKALWRAKFPRVDLDLVTLDYDEETGDVWERRREGKLICSSIRSFENHHEDYGYT